MPIGGREAQRRLEQLGFVFRAGKGDHVVGRHADGRTVTIPLHRELKKGTLRSIERMTGETWSRPMAQTFIARLQIEPEGGFSVTFADAPGAISEGDSWEEAVANAQTALELWLEECAEAGDSLPPRRSSEEIVAQIREIYESGVAVPADISVEPPAKAVRVNISMDETLLSRIDRAAKRGGRSRSRFLADAARDALRGDD